MSGGSKRRHSKWDNKGSESLPEDFYDRDTPRRPREPFSLDRGSHRHDSRSRESTMTLDREGNCTRISPELDEWRTRNSSRSPRNGRNRSLRISRSRSRSRSRSQSPVHHSRREPAINDRSRSRSGASGRICRDFAAGGCRRGHSCHFLHQDAQVYDNRRPLKRSPHDDLEGRRRRTGSSKYSPDDNKDNSVRNEKYAHICNDFLKGKCRRGDTCRFVHHDTSADEFDKGPVEEFSRNRDHEHRSRDVRDTYPDHDHRSRDTYPEHDRRSRDTYPDLDHRSRDSDYNHRSREPYNDHDHRSRESYPDHDHRRKDMYPERNHESDPPRRGEIPCKYFASGNCRNGTRCRFSHQVQEAFSPERRSRDDKHDTDRKFEGRHGWDGPRWNDVPTVPTVPTVPGWEGDNNENKEGNTLRIQDEVDRVWNGPSWTDATSLPNVPGVHVPAVPGWEEDKNEKKEVNTLRIQDDGKGPDPKCEVDRVWDGPSWTDATSLPNVSGVHDWGDNKNEITEVAKVVAVARPSDDSWGHNMLTKPWDPPATAVDKYRIQDKEDPLQWKKENNIPIMGLSTPRGMDNFPGDMEISPRDLKHQTILKSSTSQIPSNSAVQLGTTDEDSSFEKHYQFDSLAVQNATYKDNAPISYPVERIEMGDHDVSSIIQNQAITIPQGQDIFQPDKNANANPIPNVTPPRPSQPSILSRPLQGEGMQVSQNPSIVENRVVDGPHIGSVPSSAPAPGSTAHSTVSNEQLAQLSNLTASLTQLLENRQQLSQLSSAISPHGMPDLHDLAAPAPPVSGAMIQPNQAPEVLKQYDPVSSSIEPKMPNMGDRHLPRVELKSTISEIHEVNNLNHQEHFGASKDDENGKETVGFKAPENEPSQDVGPDGADDSKKLKDIKEIRPFKFALAELVKELLKPFWKDGQVNKEAYKTIVKKVVDKVMETLGPQIPQTKEKIDMYLSCSRSKIDKLVQAYVGKHQKG